MFPEKRPATSCSNRSGEIAVGKNRKEKKNVKNDRVFAVWDGYGRHMPCGHSCPRMFNVRSAILTHVHM